MLSVYSEEKMLLTQTSSLNDNDLCMKSVMRRPFGKHGVFKESWMIFIATVFRLGVQFPFRITTMWSRYLGL